jgi:hypothetical protein
MSQVLAIPTLPLTTPEEEFGMTFQVALIGSDGLVCASDRKFVDYHWTRPDAKYAGERTQRGQKMASTKFVFSGDQTLACAYAGGDQSKNLADAIITNCHPGGQSLDQWERYIKSATKEIHGSGSQSMDEVIVIRRDDCRTAIRLMKLEPRDSSTLAIEQSICTGDLSGAAQFLVEHLWQPGMSIIDLERLALLTLAYASKENPSGIGEGADVLTLTKADGFTLRTYTQAQLDQMRANFDEHLSLALKNSTLPV